MLTLLVQRIGAISVELVGTSHPLPLAHVVGRHPRQIANAVHRTHDVRLEHIRSHDERGLVRGGRPARIDAEHSTLRTGRAGERLNKRVLAASVGEAGREQIRHMPEVLDDPIRTNALEQLSTSTAAHVGETQVVAEGGVVLGDALAGFQTDIEREHRTVAAVADEARAVGIGGTVADQGGSSHIEHFLRQLGGGLIQSLTSGTGLNPRQLIHAGRNRLGLGEARIGNRLDGVLGEHILIASLPRTLRADGQLLKVHAEERFDAMVEGQIVLTEERTFEGETLRTPGDGIVADRNVIVGDIASASVFATGKGDGRPFLSRSRLDGGGGERGLGQTRTLRILAALNHVEPHRAIRGAFIDVLRERLSRYGEGVEDIGTSHVMK